MRTINQHVWAGQHCIVCGAPTWEQILKKHSDAGLAPPLVDPRTCVDWPDYTNGGKLAPEPKRREIACEDAETISARLAELRAAAVKTRPPDEPAPDVALGYVDQMMLLSELSVG